MLTLIYKTKETLVWKICRWSQVKMNNGRWLELGIIHGRVLWNEQTLLNRGIERERERGRERKKESGVGQVGVSRVFGRRVGTQDGARTGVGSLLEQRTRGRAVHPRLGLVSSGQTGGPGTPAAPTQIAR